MEGQKKYLKIQWLLIFQMYYNLYTTDRSNQKLSETHPKDVINGSPSVIKGLLGQALETTQIRPAEGLSQVFDPEQR